MPMKILSITAQKPHSTGSGTYMTELVKAFDRMGHTQAVVCGIYRDDTLVFPEGVLCCPVFFSDDSGLPFPIAGMSDIMPYPSTRYRDLTTAMVGLFEAAFTDAISRAVDELDPDLIICHHLFLLTALVRKNFPDRKIVGISHGTDLRQMINCGSLRGIVRPYIREIDLALALHGEQRRQIIDIFGIDESRVSVIGSGYSDRLFNTEGRNRREPEDPLRLTYAGKISRPKGVPEMLAALERLDADTGVPDFMLTMAGGCQDEVMIEKLRELPPWAGWLGQIPQPALAELLRRTDIFILPSYFEGLPLVLIEAMAAGAVPVSTDLPGIRSWIDDNVNGSNAVFIPMPQMESIDEPSEAGRNAFIGDMSSVLRETMSDLVSGKLPGKLPDTSSITWDSLASRLLEVCG